jgi:hypothetical protein
MDYRAYLLDNEGHISSYVELECADDEDAMRRAAQLLDGQDIEVWHRERKVALLTGKRQSAKDKSRGNIGQRFPR